MGISAYARIARFIFKIVKKIMKRAQSRSAAGARSASARSAFVQKNRRHAARAAGARYRPNAKRITPVSFIFLNFWPPSLGQGAISERGFANQTDLWPSIRLAWAELGN